jgi:hypothetical protein
MKLSFIPVWKTAGSTSPMCCPAPWATEAIITPSPAQFRAIVNIIKASCHIGQHCCRLQAIAKWKSGGEPREGKKQEEDNVDSKLTSHPVPRMINTRTYKRANTTIVAKETIKTVAPRISLAPFSSGFEGKLAGSMMIDGKEKDVQETPERGKDGAARQGKQSTY